MSDTTAPRPQVTTPHDEQTVGGSATYEIGAAARCHRRPLRRAQPGRDRYGRATITHVVVEPQHRHALVRLVPIGLVEAAARGIRLRCDLAHLRDLPSVRESEVLPSADPRAWVAVIVRAGHLWGARDVAIPIGEAGRVEDGGIYVALTRHDIPHLPENRDAAHAR